jgi:DNA invertase Pin-like site-specific DNA recombinase
MDSGLGLEAQRRLIARWGEFVREQHPMLPELEWIEEEKAVSAYKVPLVRRPGGSHLNHLLRAGDHVVFAYLDRTWRNTEDCLSTLRKWDARGVTVHFANIHVDTQSVQGKLLLTIMAACAEMDSRMKSERTKEAMAYFPSVGRKSNGHAPLGFKLVGKRGVRRGIAPDPEARRIMGEIVRYRDLHQCGWKAVSEYVMEWMGTSPVAQLLDPKHKNPWTPGRCERAYKAELELQAIAKEKAAAKIAATAQPAQPS